MLDCNFGHNLACHFLMNAIESTASRCPRCGAEIPPDALEKVCPRCALADALKISPEDHDTQFLSLHDIPPPGQKVSYIGDYELLEVIARGGMGVVYKARQKSLNRIVALKLLLGGAHASDAFKRRFRQEAETAAKLQHPNIVPIYEVGEHEGQPYFSMEYVAGTNLAALARDKPLPSRKAAEYVKAVAEAVAYAHGRGVLHRDLKPSNILLGADDRPRITDFGLARNMEADSSLTLSGETLGTPAYLPPEQVSVQDGSVGPQSDVYSLGATLYCLVTQRPPFCGRNVADTLQQVINAEPVPPRQANAEVPRDLEIICLKCLQKEPAKRYASMLAVAGDLGRFLHGEPIQARPVSPHERVVKWCRRQPVVAGLIAAVIVVAILGAAISLQQWRQGQSVQQEAKRQEHLKRLAEERAVREKKNSENAVQVAALQSNQLAALQRELTESVKRELAAIRKPGSVAPTVTVVTNWLSPPAQSANHGNQPGFKLSPVSHSEESSDQSAISDLIANQTPTELPLPSQVSPQEWERISQKIRSKLIVERSKWPVSDEAFGKILNGINTSRVEQINASLRVASSHPRAADTTMQIADLSGTGPEPPSTEQVGKVISVTDNQVWINLGTAQGYKKGDKVWIYVANPQSKSSGTNLTKVAEITLALVQENRSMGACLTPIGVGWTATRAGAEVK